MKFQLCCVSTKRIWLLLPAIILCWQSLQAQNNYKVSLQLQNRPIKEAFSKLQESTGLAFLVREMQIDFLRAALLDDELVVSVEIKERRAASILFAQTIRRADGAELIRAKVRVACVDVRRMRPVQIPADLIPGLSP